LPNKFVVVVVVVVVQVVSRYRKGYRFELKVKKLFERQGYVVYRSAGSKGAADLVALKAGEVLLIQVKVNGRLQQKEVQRLLAEARKCKATALLVVWNSKAKRMELRQVKGYGKAKGLSFVAYSKVC